MATQRTQFDDKADHTQPQLQGKYLPCGKCSTATLIVTLSHYGAQCRQCFDAYCVEAQAPQKLPVRQPMQRNWLSQHEQHQDGQA